MKTDAADPAQAGYVQARPVVFGNREVRSALAGAMSQFRRIVNPQPDEETPHFRDVVGSYSGAVRPFFLWGRFSSHDDWEKYLDDPKHDPDREEDLLWPGGDSDGFTCDRFAAESGMLCPYGAAPNPFRELGDRLWVKETWAAPHAFDHLPPRMIPRDARIHYAATEDRGGLFWRSPVCMPRWASRLKTEIVGVDLQLPCDVRDVDLRKEGYGPDGPDGLRIEWDKRYGTGSWDGKLWAWLIRFKRIEVAAAVAAA